MKVSDQKPAGSEKVMLGALLVVALMGVVDVVRYLLLGEPVSIITMVVIAILFVLLAWIAWKSRLPLLLLPVGVAAVVLFTTTNYLETTLFNFGFVVHAAVSILGAIVGTALAFWEKQKPRKPPLLPTIVFIAVLVVAAGVWGGNTVAARQASGPAKNEIWGVPTKYDSIEAAQQGTVEVLTYQTRAYATDQREVEKRAYVYLPAEYAPEKQYNILYLLHGTGDDEAYWLQTFSYNKVMLDNMIADGTIAPLIVVTPTFYVEDDCMDGLDPLTYSFKDELRNDLMPAVEERYSTYAESCDADGFMASREHRAFAGLSRGAVTTFHSVLCNSVDYFSWFGTFSGCRTTPEYIQETLQSPEFAQYSINYLYMTSGNFDFSLPAQIKDYEALLKIEPRLTSGVNTSFDVFPMRYHSMGSWHLALYNYLQRIF